MKTQEFLNWLNTYLEESGREKLTEDQLKEVGKKLKSKKEPEKLEQMEFPWKYESLGDDPNAPKTIS